MAVPKQKQSHARTAQRRAQHKITAPAINGCPQCRRPRRPHRVCPHSGFYGGREVVHGHPEVADVAVFGVEDEKFGQRLKAVIVK